MEMWRANWRREWRGTLRQPSITKTTTSTCTTITCGEVVAMGWLDKCIGYVLSTIHPPVAKEPTSIMRRKGRGQGQPWSCPPTQVDYHKFMGGVNLADQMVKTFLLCIRHKRHAKSSCHFLPFLTIIISFRLNIARQLIAGCSIRANIEWAPSQPVWNGHTEAKWTVSSLWVYRHEKRLLFQQRLSKLVSWTETSIQCMSAVVCTTYKIPLCINIQRSFWNAWHTKVEYWNYN